jgi:hypothetical protein
MAPRNEEGQIIETLSIVEEIAVKRKFQQELYSKDYFETLFDTVLSGLLLWTAKHIQLLTQIPQLWALSERQK